MYNDDMAFINWNDSLNLGLKNIDGQHRQIVSHINDLQEAVKKFEGSRKVGAIFGEIVRDIQTHFAEEEYLFDLWNYPEAEAHRIVHKELEKQIKELESSIQGGALPITDNVLTFIRDWFLTHMTGSDLVFAVWMKREGHSDGKHAQ